MASACFGGDVDLVLSKARPTASVPGRRSVLEGFQLTPASQPHLSSGSWRSGRGQQEGGGEKKPLLFFFFSLSCSVLSVCFVSGSARGQTSVFP